MAGKKLCYSSGYEGNNIMDGDWDKVFITELSITDTEVFKSSYSHWVEGKPWEETPLVKDYINKVNTGVPNRFDSIRDIKNRYKKLDDIYKSVIKAGNLSAKWEDLVIINITRNGSLIWGPDGRHRLCIALCGGLDRIPVRLGFIHSQAVKVFQNLRENRNNKIGFSSK